MACRIALRFVKLLNVIMMTLPVAVCWIYFYSDNMESGRNGVTDFLVIAVFFIFYITYCRIYEGFLVSYVRISSMIYSQCLSLLISDTLSYMVICLMAQRLLSPVAFIAALAVQAACSVIWCVLVHVWYFRTFPPKRTAIIYGRYHSLEELINTYGLKKKFDVRMTLTADDCIYGGLSRLGEMETVFLCGVPSHERNVILKSCIEQNVLVYVLPRIGDIIMSGARRMHLFYQPFLRVGRYSPSPEYVFVKRVFDIVLSVALLIVTSPVMLVTAAAIKLSDGGPVFYRQTRLTKNGREFKIIKFRSMRTDAEDDGIARLSGGENDKRVTPVGRVIRRMRIDELPQLFNTLAGSMSIVGPRPERPQIAKEYEEKLPEFALRLQAKAGLTGYAQVYGKYNTTPYDKLQMDLMYIANPSLLEDIRIIFATVKILFIPESTEGVDDSGKSVSPEEKSEDKIEV